MDGSDLRRFRARHGMTAETLASEIRVPLADLRTWEEAGAPVPRRQLYSVRAELDRVERERSHRRRKLRKVRKPAREPVSWTVFLAPGLLLAAGALRLLPFADAWAFVLYPVALIVGGVLAMNVHDASRRLRARGAVIRWVARCLVGSTGMVGFVGTFFVSGYSAIFTADEPLSLGGALLLAVSSGVGYGTIWPLAKWMRGY